MGAQGHDIPGIREMSDPKEDDHALQESEGRYRSLFESARDGILLADSEGTYVDVNPSGLRMLGYSRDELIGMKSVDILAPGEEGIQHRHEWQFRRKDGSVFDADVQATVMADGRTLALVRDATERTRMEEQLRRSQKMEAVGRLAGGMAHDFNNELGVIVGYTELLMRHASEAQRRTLDQILQATQRATGLTRQLLEFSRSSGDEPLRREGTSTPSPRSD